MNPSAFRVTRAQLNKFTTADASASPQTRRQSDRGRRGWVQSARLLAVSFVAALSFAVPTTFAATTTVSVLIDADNNAATGCSVPTVNGPFAGVDRVLNTTVVADAAGYRTQSITVQRCSGGVLGAAQTIDSSVLPIARGNGTGGATAIETYMPNGYLPATEQKLRIGITTLAANGLTGSDALTLSGAGAILVDGPPLVIVPTLATASLALTALLLVGSLWMARRRGWHALQLGVVMVFALSLSGQLIAAIVRDGLIADWTGITPAAIDPAGDAPPGVDITNVYSTVESGNVFFRIDTLLNSPPVANAQTVTVIAATSLAITLTGADFEASPLTFTVVTTPAQGVLTGTAPNLTYTANALATASDSFTFKVNDGSADSAVATVAIGNTRAPTITSANNVIFIPTQANTFAFAANGIPTPTASFGTCSPALPSVTFAADSSGGGTLSGNPTVAEAGVHTCTFTSSNGVLPNATQSFTLTVGGAPTITSVATLSVPELAAFTHTVTTSSVLPITGMTSVGALPTVATFTYAGATAATATIAGTPALCSRSTYPVTLGVSNSVASSTQSFNLTVRPVNQLPSFSKGADVTVLEDVGAQTVAGWATARNAGAACESAQTLSFEIVSNSNAALFSAAPAVNGSNGDLTFTPAANANGSATITLRITDNGGTADGGVDTSATQSFVINVTAVNDAPSFVKGADVIVLQNAAAQTITPWATAISAGPADEAAQTVTFQIVANSNAAMFSAGPAISPTGTLTFTPATNQPGTATITINLKDSGGSAGGGVDTSANQTFVITVATVNQPPSFAKGVDPTVLEEAAAQTLVGWATAISPGPASEAGQTVSFNVTGNTNAALFSAGPLVSATGTLTYTPAANANGAATLTLTLQDNGGSANGGVDTSAAQTFVITVTAVNDAPSFVKGADPTVLASAGAQTLTNFITAISPGPANEAAQTVTLGISNATNAALFSAAPALTGSGATRTLSFTPASNNCGASTITIQAQDNGGTANSGVDTSSQTTLVTVSCVNQPPSFTKGVDPTVLEEAAAQTLVGWVTAISPGPASEAGQTVAFNVTGNTNTALFSAGPLVSPTGTLTYTPAANANGTASITLTLQDNGGTANGGVDTSAAQTFVITVTAVNDAPSFVKGPDVTVLQNAAAQTITPWATAISTGPADEAAQTVTFQVVGNSNPALFSVSPAISPTGTLTFTPATNQPGTATITINLKDSGGTANGGVDTSPNQTFVITVTAVNQAPSFIKGADQSAFDYNGAQTVTGWATAISAGPNEGGQTVNFIVSNSNSSLFSTAPAVSATGTLTYTPALAQSGAATVSVQIHDNGGTANGGADTSAVQTFVINVATDIVDNVAAVNDPPVAQNKTGIAIQTNMKRTDIDASLLTGVTDADRGVSGCAPTYSVASITSSSGGTVSNVNLGLGTFDPAPSFTDTAAVNYTVSDNSCPGVATSAPATINHTVSGPGRNDAVCEFFLMGTPIIPFLNQ